MNSNVITYDNTILTKIVSFLQNFITSSKIYHIPLHFIERRLPINFYEISYNIHSNDR